MTKKIYNEGIARGTYKTDITAEFDARGDGNWLQDKVHVTVICVDEDVDSDNTRGVRVPERDEYEDRIEDATDKLEYPGKFVVVNDGDADGDEVIDYADWHIMNGPSFVPYLVTFQEPLDVNKLRLRLTYEGSDPVMTTDGVPPSGELRLWRKNASTQRDPRPSNAGGDYVAPDEYEGPDLLRLPWASARTVILGMEGVNATDRAQIQVEVDPDGTNGPAQWVHLDAVRVTILKVDLSIDSDNNGKIEDADENAEGSKEFLFWLNNNNDFGYVWGHDCDDDVIGGAMDLQDLAPFKVTLSKDLFPSESKAFLEMDGGSAVVRVFKHRGTEKQHLNNSTIANSMASDSDYRTGTVGGGDRIELDLSDFANDVPTWFVLEGETPGAGKLCVVLRKTDGTELCRDEVLLNLHDVDDLWSEINLRNCTGPSPAAVGPIYTSWASGIASDDVTWNVSGRKWGRANSSLVISIHGYNNTEAVGRDYNRTVFKRLYWQGYRSGLAGVFWTGDEGTAVNFNNNVFNSFQAGSALGSILPSIKIFAGSRDLVMMTHSLGNNVASEAIRDNAAGVVKNYMMFEAATGAGAYLNGVIEPGDENPKLLAQARTFGYAPQSSLVFDELWRNRWANNPDLHPGQAHDWWPPPPATPVAQPSFVDYQIRWGDCYANPDPQRGYFAAIPGKLGGVLYCGYSAADAVVGDTEGYFNAWMDNQIGFIFVDPHRPDSGADGWDWDFGDMFDEELPEQVDSTATPNVITAKMRKWAELSYYFCDLTMAAGAVGIGNGTKYQSDNSLLRGINAHGAMRDNALHEVWDFWGWVGNILGP